LNSPSTFVVFWGVSVNFGGPQWFSGKVSLLVVDPTGLGVGGGFQLVVVVWRDFIGLGVLR
jgi:hypothetical protein